jgi:hypothetical protein
VSSPAINGPGPAPRPAPGAGGPVLLVVAGCAVSQAAIARTAELAAGALVTVVGVGSNEIFRTDSASSRPLHPTHQAGETRPRVPSGRPAPARGSAGPSPRPALAAGYGAPSPRAGTEPEQVRRTVALAMSVLENTGVMATGHVAVGGSPARAVARMARACGARVVILDQSGTSASGHPVRPGASGTGAARGGAGPAGLMAELRRRMYGSGIVVLAETDRRGGWVSA